MSAASTDPGEPVVVVWSAADAAAALSVARETGDKLRVLVPGALANVLGGLGVRALREQASATGGDEAADAWIIDCGDHAGLALAMLRNGFPAILLDPATPARPAVAAIAQTLGARVLDALDRVPRLDLAAAADPAKCCRRWLASLDKPSNSAPNGSLPSL